MSADKLPSLPLPLPSQAYSSSCASPRLGSIASSVASSTGSQSSYTSTSSSNGPKTPSPTLPVHAITSQPTAIVSYDAMNSGSDMFYPQHMPAGHPPHPPSVPSGPMGHYQQAQQPPLLHSGPAQYPASSPYGQYGYPNGLTSPPTGQPVASNGLAATSNVLPLPNGDAQNSMHNGYVGFDTTGQHPPQGMKPRVTATLWEDEGSLCFQVEARGICVARREDNHMINGTKLLNVAGMTRGRRDGILKSEKVRHVVKIGPMHLKGVWIPYERALDFANKEKITELLYPLFVHNIGALLYQSGGGHGRGHQVMTPADRRKQETQGHQLRTNAPPGLPSLQQHHSHHVGLPTAQQATTLPSHAMMGRSSIDRSHAFPTPPTSASGVMGNMGASEGFGWQGQGMNGGQGMSIEAMRQADGAGSANGDEATTPPSTALATMQSYPSGTQSYDGSRQMYSAPASQHSPYQTAANGPQDRMYGQTGPYAKSEMGPPSSRPSLGAHQGEQHDQKPTNGILPSEQTAPHAGEEEGEHEQDTEYTHDSGAYDNSRSSYNYTAPGVGALANDGNMGSELTGSPSHAPASGRATPRTTAPHQPYYSQHAGYSTPPRVQPSSNLFNVTANERSHHNGASSANDVYGPPTDMAGSMANGYAPASSVMNGSAATGIKRGRDDDDDMPRSANDGPSMGGSPELKRRRTMMESSVSTPIYEALSRPSSAIAAPTRR